MSDPDPHCPDARSEPCDELERGRECFRRRAWARARELLAAADQTAPLGPEDLESLAISAYLVGRDEDYLKALARAHQAHLVAGEGVRAVRCAFWLGLRLLFRGETGSASGWLARAQRLLEHEGEECVEQGYLLLPVVQQQLDAGNSRAAFRSAADAAGIGERFGEIDLVVCARHLQGLALIHEGTVEAGLALLDEAMVAVIAGELSPLVTGLIYCSVIEGCHQVYALDRAREWTTALANWCEAQPEMLAFSGVCRVHRSEIMQLRGAWPAAIEEAHRARTRSAQAGNAQAVGAAFYQQAEVHRLRGEFAAAEAAYRSASESGQEPQPGLALLRLAQGRAGTAAAAIRRVVGATTGHQRTRLLTACVDIMLAVGDSEQARAACRELQEVARRLDTGVLHAMAAQAQGALELADSDPQAALGSLRRAGAVWQEVEAPYMCARVRVMVGLACRALGDDEGCRLEFEAARAVFEQLGAAPDLAHIDRQRGSAAEAKQPRLTPRELQVLRLVATGRTNKAIANELFVSEKTIDRHVSNIFDKIAVTSRSAATAYAYQHQLT
ncbi:helix-turn-helix transcriptional regulator [Variovorax sp. J22R115]|uniref:helix-turn-helix transcriptional regulator n=1 Tax=Variovorax sp. J22R115 TaxID=3053509 RepID=UPI002574FA4E|nr:helix-turn-helix transcriptional regulator [Variovorax sp. J22R115]MDM0049720.1 response regulator transcription factor [Variovorax sp. J22R115]